MDLTPDALRETTFRGALRGYNVDDVDEFVEKVAVGMTELLHQLRLSSERAAGAERQAKEVATSEDAMRRTLGHAQQLAEAVLAEARQDAARVTEEATQEAAQLRARAGEELAAQRAAAASAAAETERHRAEALAERARMQAEAEVAHRAALAAIAAEQATARRQLDVLLSAAAERVDADLQSEIQRLQGVRQALQLDVAVLTSWMHDQRDSVRNVLVETLAALDRAAPVDEPPPVTEVDATIRLAAGAPDLAEADAPEPGPVPEAATAVHDQPEPGDVEPDPEPHRRIRAWDPPADDEEAAMAQPVHAELYDRAPPTFPDLSDDEFLAELKKAAAGGDDSLFGPGDQEHHP